MKIFPSSSIKKLDAYTIEHEPIASIDLMERQRLRSVLVRKRQYVKSQLNEKIAEGFLQK